MWTPETTWTFPKNIRVFRIVSIPEYPTRAILYKLEWIFTIELSIELERNMQWPFLARAPNHFDLCNDVSENALTAASFTIYTLSANLQSSITINRNDDPLPSFCCSVQMLFF